MRSAWAWAVLMSLLGCSAAPLQPPSPLESSSQAPARPVSETGASGLNTAVPVLRAAEVAFSFERTGRAFGGRLTLPERHPGQRLPGVVLVHGSGPMSRDGFMPGQLGLGFGFDFPVYAELARELAALGYAVVRYDKRTCLDAGRCGPHSLTAFGLGSSVVADDASIDDFVEDAKAAYHKLTEYEFIDSSRVVFVGHSQGAQLVPRLLTELEAVPSGIMLTPPYQGVPELLRQQGERLVRVMRQAKRYERVREGYELIRASRILAELAHGGATPTHILGQPVGLWRSWMRASQEAPQLARALNRPLLVVGGTYDYNVAPEELRLWSQWLSGSPHRVTVLPCVTHALNCISQADPTQIEARHIGRRIDSSLMQSLKAFLGVTLARRSRDRALR